MGAHLSVLQAPADSMTKEERISQLQAAQEAI